MVSKAVQSSSPLTFNVRASSKCGRLHGYHGRRLVHQAKSNSSAYSALIRAPHNRPILVTGYGTSDSDNEDLEIPGMKELRETEQRLKPFTLTAPTPEEHTPTYVKRKIYGSEPKDLRAAPAIALHAKLSSDPDTLAVYSDGSIRHGLFGGAAAAIPTLNVSTLLNLGLMYQVRRSCLAEYIALAVACELAAAHAKPGRNIALFTDGQYAKSLSQEELKDPQIYRAIARAYHALQTLDRRGCPVAVYWVPGHRGVIDGIIIAHRLANEASIAAPRAMSTLLLAPASSAGVALDHVGPLSVDRGKHHFYVPAYPRRRRPGGTPQDGLSFVNSYKHIREQYVHMNKPQTLTEALALQTRVDEPQDDLHQNDSDLPGQVARRQQT